MVMVPTAVAVPRVAPLAFDRVRVKVSLGSTTVSPTTLTRTVLLASPAAKLTMPVGRVPPAKSLAAAAFVPDPVTAQLAEAGALRSPLRVTVKLKAVEPEFPSARLTFEPRELPFSSM